MTERTVGVLALQGDFERHASTIARLGIPARLLRRPEELADVDGVVLPGGESTTMLKLMEGTAWEEALRGFHARGGALFGTCAGLILLARGVHAPGQRSLGILDVDVDRNAYGRQVDSFEAPVAWQGKDLRGVFIRAPLITRVGKDVRVLARRGEEPVLVQEGRVLAASFHPELTDDLRVHDYFVHTVMNGNGSTSGLPKGHSGGT